MQPLFTTSRVGGISGSKGSTNMRCSGWISAAGARSPLTDGATYCFLPGRGEEQWYSIAKTVELSQEHKLVCSGAKKKVNVLGQPDFVLHSR